jgi:hypothetical protein
MPGTKLHAHTKLQAKIYSFVYFNFYVFRQQARRRRFFTVDLKYLNFATCSEDLLAFFMVRFCAAFWWWGMNTYFLLCVILYFMLTSWFLSPVEAISLAATQEYPEGSLPCSQEPSTGSCPEPDQSSPYHPCLSKNVHFHDHGTAVWDDNLQLDKSILTWVFVIGLLDWISE